MSLPLAGNDWSVLRPVHDSGPMPSLRVTVCIPTRDPGDHLDRVLDALAVQTYPRGLIDVVVADDGSAEPVQVGSAALPVTVVRVEHPLPFGAGRARNVAAYAATGEVLVFLDGDVIPERQVIETYVRWFTERDDVLVTGLCRFADVSDLSAAELQGLVADGGLEQTFAGREVDDQDWRETTFGRTDDLRSEAVDAFRVVIGATLAISARQLAAVGGFRELGIRGIEDTELGYRVHADGAVLVLDRTAVHWHQGRRTLSAERKQQIMAARTPFIERLIPLRSFRPAVPDPLDEPVATVPRLVVHVAAGAPAPEVPADCVVVVGDTEPVAADGVPFVPALGHVWSPPGATWSSRTATVLVKELETGSGAARVPGPGSTALVAVRTRVLRRARREDPGATDVDVVARALEAVGASTIDAERAGVAWCPERRGVGARLARWRDGRRDRGGDA